MYWFSSTLTVQVKIWVIPLCKYKLEPIQIFWPYLSFLKSMWRILHTYNLCSNQLIWLATFVTPFTSNKLNTASFLLTPYTVHGKTCQIDFSVSYYIPEPSIHKQPAHWLYWLTKVGMIFFTQLDEYLYIKNFQSMWIINCSSHCHVLGKMLLINCN